jgi:hypothetical protein
MQQTVNTARERDECTVPAYAYNRLAISAAERLTALGAACWIAKANAAIGDHASVEQQVDKHDAVHRSRAAPTEAVRGEAIANDHWSPRHLQ